MERLSRSGSGWIRRSAGSVKFERKQQIANYADFCNECGNCDIFCPEHGGPYRLKPRFFGSAEAWREAPDRDGFFLEDPDTLHGRFEKKEFRLAVGKDGVEYSGPGFRLRFNPADIPDSVRGTAEGEVDLTYYHHGLPQARGLRGKKPTMFVKFAPAMAAWERRRHSRSWFGPGPWRRRAARSSIWRSGRRI